MYVFLPHWYNKIYFCCSPALGQGWRIGFLGLLHMEVFNQRLEQEYGAEAIVTAPSVTYKSKDRWTLHLTFL